MSSLIAPSLNTIVFRKDVSKTNSHFKLKLLEACVLVTPVFQLISPLCQVVHSEAPHSKAPGKNGVFVVVIGGRVWP